MDQVHCPSAPTAMDEMHGIDCTNCNGSSVVHRVHQQQLIKCTNFNGSSALHRVHQLQRIKCTNCNGSSALHRVHQLQCIKCTNCNVSSAPTAMYQVHQPVIVQVATRCTNTCTDTVHCSQGAVRHRPNRSKVYIWN